MIRRLASSPALSMLAVFLALATHRLDADPPAVNPLDLEPHDTQRDRTVPVRLYRDWQDEQRQPIVIFSHGLGGSRNGCAYLGEHWAAHGYTCVFLQHAGSDREIWRNVAWRDRLDAVKSAINAQSFADRVADVSFILDQLQHWHRDGKHPLYARLDLEHIGMSGHSYGALTTLALAGRKYPTEQRLLERRLDAFVAFSPSPGTEAHAAEAFAPVRSPVLCLTGTEDRSPLVAEITPARRREVYQALPVGNKYELVFDGGHHFTFSDSGGLRRQRRNPAHHPAIERLTLQFWNAYLRGDQQARQWLQSDQPRQDCHLVDTDVWQWK